MSDIYFAQIREDSEVERRITKKYKPKKIMMIGSGGCSAFSILDEDVTSVIAVDMNPAQCALIELKKTAIATLDQSQYIAFIGEGECLERLKTYDRLKEDLSDQSKLYWDNHLSFINKGINHCGVTERFYRFIGGNICEHIVHEKKWQELFKTSTIAEQWIYYKREIKSDVFEKAVELLLSRTSHLVFYPDTMFSERNTTDYGAHFLQLFETYLQTDLIKKNYFLSQLLFGRYINMNEGLPYYMSLQGYERIKANLDKLTIIHGSLDRVLEQEQNIDAFYLSNVFDWMGEEERNIVCERLLLAKHHQAIVLFRNMLSCPTLPRFFEKRFFIEEELSNLCQTMERSLAYEHVTVGMIS
ncbi:DUF3419 family protein [Alkalihalobacterium bogoriense]|uniref:DUF3419 family protein n=1 Tax=Alkalihalobacterium bogoriense TaxID=246272 RepID=UPI00047E850C|nr:DUF3419 family protein [Alkalihalobacterium bogoriense]